MNKQEAQQAENDFVYSLTPDQRRTYHLLKPALFGRPCDTCGGRFADVDPRAECPKCFAEDEQQRAEIDLKDATQALHDDPGFIPETDLGKGIKALCVTLATLRQSHYQLDEACGKIHEICALAGIPPGPVAARVQLLKDRFVERKPLPGVVCLTCGLEGISGYDNPNCMCPRCGDKIHLQMHAHAKT